MGHMLVLGQDGRAQRGVVMNDPWWDNKSYDVVAMLFIHGIGMFAVELTSNLWVQGAIIIPASLGTLAFF